ncbi:MAG: ATP-binding protein [Pleomorphochaeta sp.]
MDRIKNIFKNLSLKKSFMLYMLLFLVIATILSSITINFVDDYKYKIQMSYSDISNNYSINNDEGKVLVFNSSSIDYSSSDNRIIKLCSFISSASIPVFFGVGIILAAFLFYKNKLKKPLELLNDASKKISETNLDFHIIYDSKDEMGQLCNSFETMRKSLEENNLEMWRAMEERKRLNAAFSHDLRTPLTVLKGYLDFLEQYLPENKISKEKMLSTFDKMSSSIDRLENYTYQMSEIQRLEDIQVDFKGVDYKDLINQLKSSSDLLILNTNLKLNFKSELIDDKNLLIDSTIIMRVYENIISNSIRFAKSMIDVNIYIHNPYLIIEIEDDGKGFSDEDLKNALNSYYKNNPDNDKSHFGLGLYISNILIKKHNGLIKLSNSKDNGAKVNIKFLINN